MIKRYNVEMLFNKMAELKMNKKQFADYCGVNVYYINRIINQQDMDAYKWYQIASHITCILDEFIAKEYFDYIQIKHKTFNKE